DPFQAPKSLSIRALLKKFDKHMHVSGKDYGRGKARRDDPWNLMIVAGMWFQDLFNYDFRRTEMCIIPYGTQEGEISFCAYNTGVGWRNIIEKMHQNATVAEWYKEHGRHQIYAGNKPLELDDFSHGLSVNERDLVDKVLHQKGVALTASEERLMRSLAMRKANAEAAQNPLRVL
ncbi:MAG TPA: radical SAM protein, partial [Acidobacteriota bacterium]